MIPKIIHYCWFGGNPKSELIEKCIESWKKYCPDFEICEWNETNFDVSFCQYTREAYEAKKWAFVSDVARLWVIYNYGYIYLDTDVELIKSIDFLLEYKAFFAFENQRAVATGLGMGAESKSWIIKQLLEDYKNRAFVINGKIDLSVTCSHINTRRFELEFPNFRRNNEYQNFDEIVFLPSDYMNAGNDITKNSISIHHSARSWLDGFDKNMIKKWGPLQTKIITYLRKPENIEKVKSLLGRRGEKLYVFLTFDLIDLGIIYFLKRKR